MVEAQKIETPSEGIFVGEEGNPISMDAANDLNLSLMCARDEAYGCYTEVTEVTPEMATILLEHNPHNRALADAVVNMISKDIVAGRFILNGETIVIADDGNIIDGQFRLNAVIKADEPVVSVMVFGLPYDVRMTADQGRARSVADYLRMAGHDHHKEQGAAATLLMGYQDAGSFRQLGSTRRLSKTSTFEFVKANPELLWAAGLMKGYSPGSCFVPKSVLVAVTAVLSKIDKDEAEVFIRRFITQVGLAANEPIYVLHKGLQARRNNKIHVRTWDMGELLIRAWNAQRKGNTPGHFQVTGKTPKPV